MTTRFSGRTCPRWWPIVLLLGASGCQEWTFTEIASGFDLQQNVRPPLAEDGTVAAVKPSQLLLGDGSGTTVLDLAPFSLEVTATTHRKPVQIRSEGDVVFVADRLGARECTMKARGAYRLSFSGGPLTTLFEECFGLVDDGQVGGEIAMSANGTVAFSQIVNGNGALYRGPALGPVSVLRSGTGTFYNTGALDVNDSERVMVQMEHTDLFLRRGILAFDTPEQDLASIDTAIEKLDIGQQPRVSMNASGTVAFSLDSNVTISIGGMMYSYVAGVYVATPTPFNTPKSLTLIADLSGDYCRFGAVEINDAGEVVFEAQIDGELGCLASSFPRSYDGLFTGPDPVGDAVVRRGNGALGDHQFFDSVLLGETNNAGQVSFRTTYSEPLVEPTKVWRADRVPARRRSRP